jgi:arylsulfatase A-like enzyme
VTFLGMTRRIVPALVIAASLGALANTACGARYVRSTPLVSTTPLPSSSISRHVVVISIDGLRPDAIEAYGATTLQKLMREGSYTLAANTIHPSKTLPSHTSMLTGQPPERHGVLWNNVATADAETVAVPTVFGLVRARGYQTAAFFSKAKFEALQVEGTLDYSQAPGGWFGRWSSDRTVHDVAAYLRDASPNVLFVHLADPDAAGHANGWMTDAYGEAVRRADRSVARLLAEAERAFGRGKFSVIVTADHGGHGTDHGSDDPRDVTIPWIAWGEGVKAGTLARPHLMTMDTASTVLWLLSVDAPKGWAGSPVIEAYTGVAAD